MSLPDGSERDECAGPRRLLGELAPVLVAVVFILAAMVGTPDARRLELPRATPSLQSGDVAAKAVRPQPMVVWREVKPLRKESPRDTHDPTVDTAAYAARALAPVHVPALARLPADARPSPYLARRTHNPRDPPACRSLA